MVVKISAEKKYTELIFQVCFYRAHRAQHSCLIRCSSIACEKSYMDIQDVSEKVSYQYVIIAITLLLPTHFHYFLHI